MWQDWRRDWAKDSRVASPEGDDWVMVEKSALICESGLVSTTAEDEGVLGGQEVGVLTRKACLTLQRGRRKEQTAQREQ